VEVPAGWLIAGLIPITIGLIIVQYYAFQIQWWLGAIAVGMSFLLSLVACRATGETDTTPIGAMGKVMQLLFAALSPGSVRANLASAGIAANSASSSSDLLTDLKSGYLLGANPRKQFLAQFVGCFFGTIAIVPIWYLMVPTKAELEKFPAPATNQWCRVAQVLTKGIDSLPDSAKWSIMYGAIIGVALPCLERLVPPKHRKYFPSAMGLGLSWIVPFANALAFAIGATVAWIWSRIHRKSHDTFNIPLASGLVAGESLIQALIAMTATIVGLVTKGQ
jgi:OPT family oligopeptide transporter